MFHTEPERNHVQGEDWRESQRALLQYDSLHILRTDGLLLEMALTLTSSSRLVASNVNCNSSYSQHQSIWFTLRHRVFWTIKTGYNLKPKEPVNKWKKPQACLSLASSLSTMELLYKVLSAIAIAKCYLSSDLNQGSWLLLDWDGKNKSGPFFLFMSKQAI